MVLEAASASQLLEGFGRGVLVRILFVGFG